MAGGTGACQHRGPLGTMTTKGQYLVEAWRRPLKFDPLPPLCEVRNGALSYFVSRDLLGEPVGAVDALWQLPEVVRSVQRQQGDGSWKYPGGKRHAGSGQDYNQLQTYKVLGQLIEKYGLTRRHAAISQAAEFLFSCQTDEGDFRGIYRDQYTPNYSAGMMELLIKAGYQNDPRTERGLSWLLSMRQDDGGWAIPMRTGASEGSGRIQDAFWLPEPVQPDRSKPFSHWVTGVVLRAFAAHVEYRSAPEVRHAGELLKSRFLQPDTYTDRKAPSFWTKMTYPFWWTDVLSALDSLSWLGFSKDDPDIAKGLDWLVANQEASGLWRSGYPKAKDREIHLWTSLAACRVLKKLYG
jgi:hypothetical protein